MRPSLPLAIVLLALAPGAAAAPEGERPTVRIWGTTRLELAGRTVIDESGARWLDVQGRLASDRGEGLGGVTVRFDRDGTTERATTEPDGTFQARLRAGGGRAPWVARFDGGERWRPASATVPAPPPQATTRIWVFFAPLFVLGAALAAALGVLVARRAGGWLAQLRAGLAQGGRAARGRSTGPRSGGAAAEELRCWRVVDALRRRPLPGARWTAGPTLPGSTATAGADGVLRPPRGEGDGLVVAAGYLPRKIVREAPGGEEPLAVERGDELSLLRARDAVVALLEAARQPAARPTGQPETVLQMAGRLMVPEDAVRLAALCYGPARPLEERVIGLLVQLWERTRTAGGGEGRVARGADAGGITVALASEPADGTVRGGGV